MTTRLENTFARLRAEDRAAFVTFLTAGDPDYRTSLDLLKQLPEAGADIVEFGMPFSDPMADGPAIQAASLRALNNGQNMVKTLEMVRAFRETNADTPVVLMGYYNPIYIYGNDRFLDDCLDAGVDGLIVVDLPPEMDDELCIPALEKGISFIRLATPTTDAARLPTVLNNTSGFVYYVSVAGITGSGALDTSRVSEAVAEIKQSTDLPIAVGFGISTPDQAAAVARCADGAVVGTALVKLIADHVGENGQGNAETIQSVLGLVRALSAGIREARR